MNFFSIFMIRTYHVNLHSLASFHNSHFYFFLTTPRCYFILVLNENCAIIKHLVNKFNETLPSLQSYHIFRKIIPKHKQRSSPSDIIYFIVFSSWLTAAGYGSSSRVNLIDNLSKEMLQNHDDGKSII